MVESPGPSMSTTAKRGPEGRPPWPHNTHCERDIGLTKEMSGAIFVQSGCPDKCWPSVLEYTAQARSFFSEAPIYDYERGTQHEEDKKGKTRFEAAFGRTFGGPEYPFGALITIKRRSQSLGGPKVFPGISPDGRSKQDTHIEDM